MIRMLPLGIYSAGKHPFRRFRILCQSFTRPERWYEPVEEVEIPANTTYRTEFDSEGKLRSIVLDNGTVVEMKEVEECNGD